MNLLLQISTDDALKFVSTRGEQMSIFGVMLCLVIVLCVVVFYLNKRRDELTDKIITTEKEKADMCRGCTTDFLKRKEGL